MNVLNLFENIIHLLDNGLITLLKTTFFSFDFAYFKQIQNVTQFTTLKMNYSQP